MLFGRRSFIKIFVGGISSISAYLSFRIFFDFFPMSRSVNTKRIYLGTIKDITNRLESGRENYYLDDKKKILVMKDNEVSESENIQETENTLNQSITNRIGTDSSGNQESNLQDNHRISVYSLICTHLGCTLRPGKDNLFLECPCHGSKFHFFEPFQNQNACGRVHQGPATENLKRYLVVNIKNKIYLES